MENKRIIIKANFKRLYTFISLIMTPIWLLLVILIFANSNPPENPYLWSMAMGGILWGFSFIASSPTLFYKVYLERNKITVKNLLHRREIELEEIEFFNVIELTHYEKIFSNNIQLKLRNNKTCFSFFALNMESNYKIIDFLSENGIRKEEIV